MNQHGISSLILLFLVAIGVFILWELNEYVGSYTRTDPLASPPPTRTICLSGEQGNCNDSDDVFILNE